MAQSRLQSITHSIIEYFRSLLKMHTLPISSLLLASITFNPSLANAQRLHRRECGVTWPATDGDTCTTMSRDWALDIELFRSMNPGADCAKLVPGQEYCVEWLGPKPSAPVITPITLPSKPSSTTLATRTRFSSAPIGPVAPSPVQSGIAQNCQKWYLVSGGDNCQKIVDSYKTFTLLQFYQWNPAVGTSEIPLAIRV
ncbi:hypothetical protein GQ44DRAFT_719863 [Phaeosphaeriaceae sp. PMI808]|nr:hypothetical protein GQ44DRAFT_719863 [Phaeosphaeriaceae sp. PMI808]